MSDVVLVFPKTGIDIKNVSVELPVSLLSVAGSLLEAGYGTKIIDSRLDGEWEKSLQNELSKSPLLVCVASMTGIQIKYALKVSKFVKDNSSNGTKVVWGGTHATLMPEQTIKHPLIDAIVIGEGEMPLKNMMDALEGKKELNEVTDIAYKKKDGSVIFTPKGDLVDVNTLPELPYHLVDVEQYIKSGGTSFSQKERTLPFITSRGCPYRCSFCSTPSINRFKWRPMKAELVHERISKIVKKYNLDIIKFYDENFTSDPKRANEIADKINGEFSWYIQARMDNLLLFDLKRLEKNGLRIIQPGVESGSDRILQMVNKGENVDTMVKANKKLSETNIKVSYNFMMGFPTETYEEVMQTVDLALKLLDENKNANITAFHIFSPYLGTILFDFAVKNGFQVPKDLEGWTVYYHQSTHNPWIQGRLDMFENIAYTSRLVDGKILKQYFTHTAVPEFVFDWVSSIYQRNWRKHNFKKTLSVRLMSYVMKKRFGWI